ncbi:MAG TPA: nucleotide sugar dehydrogenase, partial [Geobacterales bacterium]|nr:nucleotide sugar dehydrogenase [Geobacterales bacterium]
DNDIIIMALPTPIDQNKNPNLKFLENALKESMRYFKKGQLLILESTTYPGTTEEMIAPAIKAKEFKIGEDFFLAYAPERIDLGNKAYPMRKIPKIIAGVTKYCTELADSFYKKIVEKTYIASSPKVAEFTKLFENVFRLINIAYVEEMAKLCEKLGIDIWEAIELAKTKPFGYMPFYPSAGAGGDCIPVNPYYLDWVAKKVDYELKLVQTAVSINEDMYLHVLNRIEEVLRKRKKDIANSRILIVGVTYKKDVADIRNSPSIRLMEALIKLGADVSYFDPFIPKIMIAGKDFNSIELNNDNIRKSDIVVVLVDHSNIDYKLLYQEAKIIFDTKNVFKENEKIIKLGSGLSNL